MQQVSVVQRIAVGVDVDGRSVVPLQTRLITVDESIRSFGLLVVPQWYFPHILLASFHHCHHRSTTAQCSLHDDFTTLTVAAQDYLWDVSV